MSIIKRVRQSFLYRLRKDKWHQLAIHHEFENYKKESVLLFGQDLELKEGEHLCLLEGYLDAKKIVKFGGKFSINDDVLFLSFDGISIEICTAEELFIVREIFVDRCYDFFGKPNTIVIDIGMNVGIASLFFAAKDEVEGVFSFEPFKPTFKQANRNLGRNPELEKKINVQNFGLGGVDEMLTLEYSRQNRGRVGFLGTKLIKNKIFDITREQVEIREAHSALEGILEKYESHSIVIKMDCEGAEFDILPNMKNSKTLEKVDILMMEYHDNEPDTLISMMTSVGFSAFRFRTSETIGMIYAIKR